jgi:ribose-phosphate pyrophosphokinase
MSVRIVAGSASASLAVHVADAIGLEVSPSELEHFPDGEIRPTVSALRGDDVYVIQSLGQPVAANLVEMLLLLDACRRSGAARTTAVIPYLAYARQDRRLRPGDALGIHVVAEALTAAGADRLVVVDPHTPVLEAMFRIPVEIITAVGVLAEAARAKLPSRAVVVAPDLGAAKLAEAFAARLDAPVAIVRKTRLTPTRVRAEQVVGEVEGRTPVIVDDMISTGGTIEAAARALSASGAAPGLQVIATHALFTSSSAGRLSTLSLQRLVVSDSLHPADLPVAYEICSIAGLLGNVVSRLHAERALEEVLAHS